MIPLKSAMDAGQPMHVCPGDYDDPLTVVAMTTTTATDYYALLGVDARRDHGADQVGLPQAGQAIPPGREPQPRRR